MNYILNNVENGRFQTLNDFIVESYIFKNYFDKVENYNFNNFHEEKLPDLINYCFKIEDFFLLASINNSQDQAEEKYNSFKVDIATLLKSLPKKKVNLHLVDILALKLKRMENNGNDNVDKYKSEIKILKSGKVDEIYKIYKQDLKQRYMFCQDEQAIIDNYSKTINAIKGWQAHEPMQVEFKIYILNLLEQGRRLQQEKLNKDLEFLKELEVIDIYKYAKTKINSLSISLMDLREYDM